MCQLTVFASSWYVFLGHLMINYMFVHLRLVTCEYVMEELIIPIRAIFHRIRTDKRQNQHMSLTILLVEWNRASSIVFYMWYSFLVSQALNTL